MITLDGNMKTQRQNIISKTIVLLLTLQLFLIGVQAENRIQQGDSPIKVLIWVINQCVPVLQQVSRREKQENKDNQK